mgnify:CR=1 FL=1
MKNFIYLSLFLSLSLYSKNSFFEIDIDGTVFVGTWNDSQKTVLKNVLQKVEDAGQTDIINFDVTDFFKSSANSSSVAGSFAGADYTNEFKVLVGANVSGAYVGDGSITDIAKGEFDDLLDGKLEGVGFSGALMLGYQFGDKTSVILNGFTLKVEDGDVNISSTGFGARYRRRLFKSSKPVMLSAVTPSPVTPPPGYSNTPTAGQTANTTSPQPAPATEAPVVATSNTSRRSAFETRVYLQTGIQYNKLGVNLLEPVNLAERTTDSGLDVTATLDTVLDLDLNITTLTIPIELSGSMRLLNFLNLYGGVGANINIGSGKGDANLNDSVISVEDSNTPGNTATTTVKSNFSEKESPAFFLPNVFAGVQLDIWKMKLLVQYRASLGHGVKNIGAGVRFAF